MEKIQYNHSNKIDLKDVEVGKTYQVVNGLWNLYVTDKDHESFCYVISGIKDIPGMEKSKVYFNTKDFILILKPDYDN